MTPAELWKFLLVGYPFTVAIEAPILFAGLSPRHSWQTKLIAGFWLTACTYPIVVLVLPLTAYEMWGYEIYLAIAEVFAPLAECLLFYFAFAREADAQAAAASDDKPPASEPDEPAAPPVLSSPYDTWRDMIAIVAANLASFLLGVLAHHWWGI